MFSPFKLKSVLFCKRLYLLFYFAGLTTFSACKPAGLATVGSIPTEDAGNAGEVRQMLKNRQRSISGWAERCGLSVAKAGCSVGDAALFNGLLCLSGDAVSCEAVRRSQGADGRMWRSEHRIASDAVNSFSRDMAMGVLAYLVTTKDAKLAGSWMNWVENNDFRMCRESTDNRCDFTPGFWMLFREVWEYIGLSPTAKMRSAFLDESVMALLQGHFSPAGYQLHLAGVNVLLRRAMGQKSSTLNSLAESLAARQPENPFFAYLTYGIEKDVIRKTLSWCPSDSPAARTEWSFERDLRQEPWDSSMGWECLMLINFLLRDLKENSGDQ